MTHSYWPVFITGKIFCLVDNKLKEFIVRGIRKKNTALMTRHAWHVSNSAMLLLAKGVELRLVHSLLNKTTNNFDYDKWFTSFINRTALKPNFVWGQNRSFCRPNFRSKVLPTFHAKREEISFPIWDLNGSKTAGIPFSWNHAYGLIKN